MTVASETGRAELVASIGDLAEEVTRLVRSVERIVAAARARAQEDPTHDQFTSKTTTRKANSKPRKAEGNAGVTAASATNVLEEAVPLSPVDEPTSQSKERPGAESLVAAGISDLYDRLGGFLKDSLQPPHEGAPSSK
jgi:hypothetical protein